MSIIIIILIILWVLGMVIIHTLYAKNICQEWKKIKELLRPTSIRIIPIVTAIEVDEIPENGIITIANEVC